MPGPTNKGERFPGRPLEHTEIDALIGACSKRAPTGVRNAALIALLWRTGLRNSEALALKPRDLHLDAPAPYVDVMDGKGHKTRQAAIRGGEALPYVQRWLDVRAGRDINGWQPVFCTLSGGPLDDSYVRHLFARLRVKAAIEARVHPHALRHTHARDLLRAGCTLEDLRAQLGHASLEVTSRYVREVCPEDRLARIASL